MAQNVLNLFKSYNQRVPKKAKEVLGEDAPEETFTVVKLKGTKTGLETKQALDGIANQLVDAVEGLVAQVKDALIAQGGDASFLAEIPELGKVRAHLLESMDPDALLTTAFRNANTELFLERHENIAEMVKPEEKETTGSRGPSLKMDF